MSSIRSHLPRPTVRRFLLAAGLLIALMFTPPGRALLVRGPDQAQLALDQRLDEVRIDSTTVAGALKSIADRAGVEIDVNWPSIRKSATVVEPISVHLHDVTVRQAIFAMFETAGTNEDEIEIDPLGKVVRIDSFGVSSPAPSMRLYNVNPLIDEDQAARSRWRGTTPSTVQATTGRGNLCFGNASSNPPTSTRQGAADEIVSAISEYPDQKYIQFNNSVFARCGYLAISRTSESQEGIAQFLKLLSTAREDGQGKVEKGHYTPLDASEVALQVNVPELNLDNVTLREAVNRLHDISHLNVVVSVNAVPTRRISLHVENVTAEQALHMICLAASDDLTNLVIQYRSDAIFAIVPDEAQVLGVLADYDVRDLVDEVLRANAPTPGGIEGTNPPRSSVIDGIVRLIQTEIEPDSWRENGGSSGSIRYVNGQLLIEQTPVNHRRVKQLFNVLRREFLGMPFEEPDLAARLKQVGADQQEFNATSSEPIFTTIADFHLDGVNIMQALRQISEMTNATFAYSAVDLAGSEIDLEKPIHLRVRDVSVETAAKIALDAVAAAGTVDVSATKELCISITRGDSGSVARIYDVRALIKAPSVSQGNAFVESEWPDDYTDLGDVIEEAIDPDSWKNNGGISGQFSYLGGRLFIRQTLKNHGAIERFLKDLGGERARRRTLGGSLHDRLKDRMKGDADRDVPPSTQPKPTGE